MATVDEVALRLQHIITDACDVAAPRSGPFVPRTSLYWWTSDLSTLRKESVARRRAYLRLNRRKKKDTECPDADTARKVYRRAKRALAKAIVVAKMQAWDELVDDLQRDPWGKPYRMVLNKLRNPSVPATEMLSPTEAHDIVRGLFPDGAQPDEITAHGTEDTSWPPDLAVTIEEVRDCMKAKKHKRTAPGPDGLTGEVLRSLPDCVLHLVVNLFDACLRTGKVPLCWKSANLVLIPKPGAPDSAVKYRPICLLADIGKCFERLVNNRIWQFLYERPNGGLNDAQFGFRTGRSTIGALLRARSFIESAIKCGEAVVAISLDIRNAFNSIPWRSIIQALQNKDIPEYIIRVIRSYLSERSVRYQAADGNTYTQTVTAGVPQGSVLGPLLWILAYDSVLETNLRPGSTLLCYADDTMVLARGNTPQIAGIIGSLSATRVARHIQDIGLTVALHKTEVVLFRSSRSRIAPLTIHVGDEQIQTSPCMKYLGVMLDERLCFKNHIAYVAEKAGKVIRALWRVLPNLRGPYESQRRLYVNMIHSVILYAAPVWADKLEAYSTYRAPLLKIQRTIALRTISAYRTVSYEAAFLLARVPPIDLLASRLAKLYERTRNGTPEEIDEAYEAADILLLRRWKVYLSNPNLPGRRVREAILPVASAWMRRRRRELNYHLTQLFSGHGAFADFLRKIGKEDSSQCFHCEDPLDNVEHTLTYCPAWQEDRAELRAALGPHVPLDMKSLVPLMLQEEATWQAVSTFAKKVLTKKEETERERDRIRNLLRVGSQGDTDSDE